MVNVWAVRILLECTLVTIITAHNEVGARSYFQKHVSTILSTGGACMVAWGGACMVALGGMCDCTGGHAWFYLGGA